MHSSLRAALSRRVSSVRFLLAALALLATLGSTSELFASAELSGSASSVSLLAGTAQFGSTFHPVGMTSDSNGNVYVIHSGSRSVMKIPVGCQSASCALTLMTLQAPPTLVPSGIAVDAQGNVYFSDAVGQRVVELPVSSTGYGAPIIIVDMPGVMRAGIPTPIFQPGALALDGSGNVFINSAFENQIFRVAGWLQRYVHPEHRRERQSGVQHGRRRGRLDLRCLA